MARIQNLSDEIVKEPETAGAEIPRKRLDSRNVHQAPVCPKTAGARPKGDRPFGDIFPATQSDARPVAGKKRRPTNRPGE